MGLYIAIAVEWIACLVVVVLIVRAVRRDDARGEARLLAVEAASRAEVEAAQAAVVRAQAALLPVGARPTVLRLTLDLTDQNSVVDVLRVSAAAERLIAGLSEYETSIGGRGLVLTQAMAAPGQVILTLTPKDATGAGSRVERVAEALNAAFNPATPTPGIIPNLGSLPGDVSGAHAVALAA